jgi:hypothetical protein
MKVDKVYCDDWVALYVDGELKCQGHDIPLRTIFNILNIPIESHEFVDEEAIELGVAWPDRFSDFQPGQLEP